MRNFLSVDLEDYGHSFNAMGSDDWPRCESRIEIGTGRLLGMFAERGVKADFYLFKYRIVARDSFLSG